ncbi:OmpA family protein [Marinomonas sp. 2405UD68-3]|uniref:OmpA family protein n=1 Tax=Marinomonas sp. 2405UD68-3 TaxID=3391835 RepID=UPI0039C94143
MIKAIVLFISIIFVSSQLMAMTVYGNQVDTRNLNDQDSDGVINIRDACPNTPAKAVINNIGCHEENTKLLSAELNILFDTGRSEVKPIYYSEVKKLADFLNDNPESSAIIEGHTDNVGSEELNKSLSQNRASAISEVLVNRFQISTDRVKAIGYGESKPIASNDSDAGRSKNRRGIAVVFAHSTTKIERWDIYSVDRR